MKSGGTYGLPSAAKARLAKDGGRGALDAGDAGWEALRFAGSCGFLDIVEPVGSEVLQSLDEA